MARCAKTVKRCWDAEKIWDSEIFVDLGVQPHLRFKPTNSEFSDACAFWLASNAWTAFSRAARASASSASVASSKARRARQSSSSRRALSTALLSWLGTDLPLTAACIFLSAACADACWSCAAFSFTTFELVFTINSQIRCLVERFLQQRDSQCWGDRPCIFLQKRL